MAPSIQKFQGKFQANAGCLIQKDGLLLAVKTRQANKWDIPSGSPAGKETPDQTAVRETFEETGLNVQAEELLEDFEGEFFVYKCIIQDEITLKAGKTLSLPPAAAHEIAEAAFIEISALTPENFRFPVILPRLKALFKNLL